jgi:hypothetical protein
MKKQISKSQRFMEYILDHPASKVPTVAKKFGITPARGYALRKKARENQVGVFTTMDMLRPVFAPPEAVPVPPVPDVDATLDARAENYGKFKDGAALMQSLKRKLAEHAAQHGKTFADDQWEALEMIVHKMGRIVNGNPDVVDHWVDIAGYATLVADRLQGRAR